MKPPPRPKNPLALAALVGAVIVVAVVLVIAAVVFLGGNDDEPQAAPTSSRAPSSSMPPTSWAPPPPQANGQLPSFTPSPDLGANCQYLPSAQPASKKVDPPPAGKVGTDPAQTNASMGTNQGPIGLTLDNGKSPCTVNSFTSLAKQGFFDNTACHRLTTNTSLSVLQCGDPTGNGTGGPGYEFANEYPTDQYGPVGADLYKPVLYPRGTLAMANAGPDTNGSQFFLVYQDSQLPPQYTVFGTIDEAGLVTLDKIAAAGVQGSGDDGPPAAEVTITSVQVG